MFDYETSTDTWHEDTTYWMQSPTEVEVLVKDTYADSHRDDDILYHPGDHQCYVFCDEPGRLGDWDCNLRRQVLCQKKCQ
jgi:hypothetical protein